MPRDPESTIRAEPICDCHACGGQLHISVDRNGEFNGIIHEVRPGGVAGDGKIGCAVFDALEDTADAFADYLRDCREALERKAMN